MKYVIFKLLFTDKSDESTIIVARVFFRVRTIYGISMDTISLNRTTLLFMAELTGKMTFGFFVFLLRN